MTIQLRSTKVYFILALLILVLTGYTNNQIFTGPTLSGKQAPVIDKSEPLWTYKLPGDIDKVKSSPAVGPDGTIYLTAYDKKPGHIGRYLYAVNPDDGTEKWTVSLGHEKPEFSWYFSPSISIGGLVLIPEVGVKAFNSESGQFERGFFADYRICHAPTIDDENETLFFADCRMAGVIFAHDMHSGERLWHYYIKHYSKNYIIGSPVHSKKEGLLYFVYKQYHKEGRDYLDTFDVYFEAIYADDGSLNTSIKLYTEDNSDYDIDNPYAFKSSPAIAADGSVYVGAGHTIFLLRPDNGKLKLEERINLDSPVSGSSVVDNDNAVYFPTLESFEKLTPNLRTSITHPVINDVSGDGLASSPVIDADRVLYYGQNLESERGIGQFIALSLDENICDPDQNKNNRCWVDGTELWSFQTDSPLHADPVMAANGNIYIISEDGTLYAFQGSAKGPLDSPWPMMGHDARHTSTSDALSVAVTPTQLNFGKVGVGRDVTESITVFNTGNKDLSIDSLVEGNDAAFFKLVNNECDTYLLASGKNCQLDVTFQPSTEKNYYAQLNFKANDIVLGNSSLSGEGVAPIGGDISITPLGFDYGAVIVGLQSIGKHFVIKNESVKSITLNSIQITGIDAVDFTSQDIPITPLELKAGQEVVLTIVFTPHTAGQKTAQITISIAGKNPVSMTLSGNGGAIGSSILRGQVINTSATPISGAMVKLNGDSGFTDKNGYFTLSDINAGDYEVDVSAKTYLPWIQNIAIPASSDKFYTFKLIPEFEAEAIQVLSVNSKYNGHVTYMDGVGHTVKFTATVDWNGHAPGRVEFKAPNKTYSPDIKPSSTISRTKQDFNMGEDFSPCGKLQVTAISLDNSQSEPFEADFGVASKPGWIIVPMVLDDFGGEFTYKVSSVNDLITSIFGITSEVSAKDPIFAQNPFELAFNSNLAANYESDGLLTLSIDLEGGVHGINKIPSVETEEYQQRWKKGMYQKMKKDPSLKKKMVKTGAAAKEFSLVPMLIVELYHQDNKQGCYWDIDGYLGIIGEYKISKTWHQLVFVGAVPIPTFQKVELGASATAMLGITDIDPWKLKGKVPADIYAKGTLGAGHDTSFSVSGWLKGEAGFTVELFPEQAIKDGKVTASGGIKVTAWLFSWNRALFRETWPDNQSIARIYASPVSGPTLISRDYLSRPDYGLFHSQVDSNLVRTAKNTEQPSQFAEINPLQSNVFPHSKAHLSSADEHLYASWVSDDPSRSDINRTIAVYSKWNGYFWVAPEILKDDKTADFNPSLQVLSDGSVFSAWENLKEVLDDDSTFEEMVAKTEIAVAYYDAQGGTKGTKDLTDNAYLDKSPRVSGTSADNMLVVWLANTANDLRGGQDSPNSLMYSFWNGTEWSEAAKAISIPYPVFKYSVSYADGKAYVVLSLDADGIANEGEGNYQEDKELYLVSFQNNVWSSELQPLTENDIPDGNPQLAIDPSGDKILVWMQDGQLTSVKNFDMASQTSVWQDDSYSTNLADFKLASTPGGRMAIVWAQPGENVSDVMGVFYDPVFDIWGKPKQLTNDTATEQYLTAGFYGEKSLMAVYDREEIDVDALAEQLEQNTLQSAVPQNITDLYTLQYELRGDLAIEDFGFYSVPDNPQPGDEVELHVVVENLGEQGTKNFMIVIYQGDPTVGGKEIGRAQIEDVVALSALHEVVIKWNVPVIINSSQTLYAIVDPEWSKDDRNRDNNSAALPIVETDLAIHNVTWKNEFKNNFSVKTTVMNQGAINSPASVINFRKDETDGELLYSTSVPPLGPMQSLDIHWNYAIDVNTSGTTLYAIVDEENEISEFNERNNQRKMLLYKTARINQPPAMQQIRNKVVVIYHKLAFQISSYDIDSDNVHFTVQNLPKGAKFIDFQNGKADFSWVPTATQPGVYRPVFTVTDDGDPAKSESQEVRITVRKTVYLKGDLDNDGDVDNDDIKLILNVRNQPASGEDDPRDLDGDGEITVLDARKLVLMCTRSRCATE